ncbi:hypothetical protein AAV94_00535 [Lampropedia cohaerens]|uniref:Uncharacterized protein n=1 Tax=Lampropedia cohaerens TaxID=1610491 RepID=A0A0U1Q3D5_9BURK|nr:rod shape-determining protein MreD [Lampropedia cohaerens]KKW69256.1 hypothetical protein AAV94_00535 [Lampropedia cohaerens]
MPMPPSEQILRPARQRFIVLSLLLAFCLQIVPLGQLPWRPDVLLLVLVFWGLHQPQRIGIGTAFALGVAMDVQAASLLGQHALAYAVVVTWVQSMANRLLWYPSGIQQAVLLLVPFVLATLLQMAVGWAASHSVPPLPMLLAPLAQALLWPLTRHLLLAPQLSAPTERERRRL